MTTNEAPPRKGDKVSWRGHTWTVMRVFKWRIHLQCPHMVARVSCLKPISEGGFSEATVVQRAGG